MLRALDHGLTDLSVFRDDSSNDDIDISAAIPFLGLWHGRSDRTPKGFAKITELGLRWLSEHVFARIGKLRDCLRNLQLGNTGKGDRKSTRLNSSHVAISYAVFCLKKKKNTQKHTNTHLTSQPLRTPLAAR